MSDINMIKLPKLTTIATTTNNAKWDMAIASNGDLTYDNGELYGRIPSCVLDAIALYKATNSPTSP